VADTDVEEFEVPEKVATYIGTLEKRLTEMEGELELARAGAGGEADLQAEIAKALEAMPEPIRKRFEEQESIAKAATEAAAKADEIAKAERDLRLVREHVEKAAAYSRLPGWKAEEMGPVLKSLHEQAPEVEEKLLPVLQAAQEAIVKGTLFSELGTARRGVSSGEVSDDLEAKAQAIVEKSDGKVTIEKARVQVLSQHPELYDKIEAERAGQNGHAR
jgi:hypothetical protein